MSFGTLSVKSEYRLEVEGLCVITSGTQYADGSAMPIVINRIARPGI